VLGKTGPIRWCVWLKCADTENDQGYGKWTAVRLNMIGVEVSRVFLPWLIFIFA
jgi:hypothetical protein